MPVIATAGHVDHGKSTLVRRLTGTDPDRWEEEHRRGLTIDLGFAEMQLPSGGRVGFIDVPGHARFVKNMLAGVGSVQACLLVVDANEGWKPQSEEHLRILELVGVRNGLIALSKAAAVEADLLGMVHLDVTEAVAGTFLAGAPIIAVDALSGRGIPQLEAAIDRLVLDLEHPADLCRPRLWIDRSFSISGAGAVVTGTLAGGALAVADGVSIVTSKHVLTSRIRGLQSFGRSVDIAQAGSRVAVNLAGLHYRDVRRGDALVTPNQWHLTRRVDASLTVLTSSERPVTGRAAVAVHIGSNALAVRVQILGASGTEPGSVGFVRLFLPRALPLLPGDRYILRDLGRGQTIGGGEILDIDPQSRGSARHPDRSVDRVLRERGWMTVDDLERLTGERRPVTLGRWVTDAAWEETARARLDLRIEAAGEEGLDLSNITEQERALLDELVDVQVGHGRVRRVDAAGLAASLAQPFLDALDASPFTPPPTSEFDLSPTVLRDLKQQGRIVERDGIVFSSHAVHQAALIVARLLADQPSGISVSEIRVAMGSTRKWTLPLVALLDTTGATRRRDELRIAGPRLPSLED